MRKICLFLSLCSIFTVGARQIKIGFFYVNSLEKDFSAQWITNNQNGLKSKFLFNAPDIIFRKSSVNKSRRLSYVRRLCADIATVLQQSVLNSSNKQTPLQTDFNVCFYLISPNALAVGFYLPYPIVPTRTRRLSWSANPFGKSFEVERVLPEFNSARKRFRAVPLGSNDSLAMLLKVLTGDDLEGFRVKPSKARVRFLQHEKSFQNWNWTQDSDSKAQSNISSSSSGEQSSSYSGLEESVDKIDIAAMVKRLNKKLGRLPLQKRKKRSGV